MQALVLILGVSVGLYSVIALATAIVVLLVGGWHVAQWVRVTYEEPRR